MYGAMTISKDRGLRGKICLAALLAICCATASSAAKQHRTTSSSQSTPVRTGSVSLHTPNPSTPLEHNNRGVELGSKGIWPDAIREHEAALNGDPYNQVFRQNLSGAQMRYGVELAKKNNYVAAIGHLREALYADPTNAEADHLLDQLIQKTKGKDDLATRLHEADEQEINGNFAFAIVEYRKCVLMDDSGPTRAKLGRVLLKQGKIREAFNELKTAVEKSWPEDAKNDLAECHRELAEIEKDQAAIARDHNRMAVALKRLDNAMVEYRRAVTINPNNTDAAHGFVEVARDIVAISPTFNNHFLLAGAYQLAGDYEHAKMEYETCWHLDRNNDLLPAARRSYHLAVVSHPRSPEIVAGTVQKVEDELRKSPNDAELLYIYGRGKEVMGEPDTALKAYQMAASINAFVYPDLKERIRSLSGQGSAPPEKGGEAPPSKVATAQGTQKTPGKETVGPEKTGQPAVDPVKNLSDYSAIENKFRSNDIDGAQSLALALVEKDPHDAKGWLFLGRTHEKKGDMDQASVAYRQAAYLKDPEAKDALRQVDISRVQPMLKEADEAIKKGNWVQAAASLKDAITLAPNLSIVHRRLSEVLKQLGDTKEAQREAKRADELEKDTPETKEKSK
jgi:tetratricopeptide (TPR) repeat protein